MHRETSPSTFREFLLVAFGIGFIAFALGLVAVSVLALLRTDIAPLGEFRLGEWASGGGLVGIAVILLLGLQQCARVLRLESCIKDCEPRLKDNRAAATRQDSQRS